MAMVPKRVEQRIVSALKKYKGVVKSALDRDVNESDTVTIVKDLMAETLGYDKYSEITSEYEIRGTYCDLAIKIDEEVKFIIEVKAAGIDLKDNHKKQAVDYAANKGIEWVILTNSVEWKIYKVIFEKPVDAHLVHKMSLIDFNAKSSGDLNFIICSEQRGAGQRPHLMIFILKGRRQISIP